MATIEHFVASGVAAHQTADIAVIVERRYLSQAQPAGMISSLRKMGHSVLLIDPEEDALEAGDHSWTGNVAVAIGRGRSWGVLCRLAWLERRGIRCINRRSAIGLVHNKAEMAVALATAEIPTLHTWIGPIDRIAAQVPAGEYPLIMKPVFGDNCRGLALADNVEALRRLDWPEATVIAQRFLAGREMDLKLYCIGAETWAVRKASPLVAKSLRESDVRNAALVPLTPEMRSLARRCGDLFNLELYGVDCLETEDGPVVIEVNEFPNYSAVPGADEKLARFVLAFAEQERNL